MASHELNPATVPKTYAELRRRVHETLLAGQARIDRLRLQTYWQTGQLIDDHFKLHAGDTGYGTRTTRRLTRDLDLEQSLLYRCLRFARAYPIFAARQKLTWTHYRVLSFVKDTATRRALEQKAVHLDWTGNELDRHIRVLNAAAPSSNGGAHGANGSSDAPDVVRLLTPKRGTPGLHLVVDRGAAGLAVDLGFRIYRALTPEQQGRLEKGAIVRPTADRITRVDDATKADLFTYAAVVCRVIDGDTLVIAMEFSPGIFREETLRLRGLDCPEMSCAEGKAAQRFTQSLLAPGQSVIVHTTKPDKYARYLADVFVPRAEPADPSAEDVFLNNALLENHHAARKDAWEFGDWGLV